MNISACLIVKDDSELTSLEKAIDSIARYVDGVYVTATGDNVDGIEKLCKDNDVNYSYFKWNDSFADARNFNFAQAPQDSDYIFWMDADDILIGGHLLREIAERAVQNNFDLVFFTYWYACTFNGDPSAKTLNKIDITQMRERLIRPGTNVWKGRLHETPVPVDGARLRYTKVPYGERENEYPIALLHTATDKQADEKMERNKRILEIQLTEEREKGEADPRTLLYLMKIYAEQDVEENWTKVIDMGKEYLTKSGWDEERSECHEYMALAYQHMKKEHDAIEELHAAIKEWPSQPITYVKLATAYYNVKNYRACKHWLNVASQMDLDNNGSKITNYHALKVMFADLLLRLNYNVDRDTKKALEAANMLYTEQPTEQNKEQLLFLQDTNDLNEACKNTDQLAKYLVDIGQDRSAIDLLDVLPAAISEQPFAIKIRQSFTPPRKWKENEICYLANFGGKHFEKWDSTSLEKGIGGSETAVIELSKEWTKLGYKVTVYGDPHVKGNDHDGITWLPWYYFNKKDFFNIFIQWRGWQLAGLVKARKFYVDLHDLYSSVDIRAEDVLNVDKFMVKSNYHRMLAQNIPDEKFLVVSNGIRI